jgi:dihydrofolate synthase/folylpolyglutamate synthase
MKLDELADWLAARTTGGIRWGLGRTEELLAGADDPHRRFRSLHIGGTNGKGSVAALCDAALRAGGAGRVGLYTSPHLISFAERIRIDGRPASEEAILAAAERLLPDIERTGATFFEAATAIAFLCFAEAGVDLAVVEVGLGGRLDSTNVITPLAAAVTNVALEHTQYLGNTLEEIAGEKAGIFKPGIPAITGERNPATLAVLRERAEAAGTRLIELGEQVDRVSTESRLGGSLVRFDSRSWGIGRELDLPLAGEHQARNALLAAELLALLPEATRPSWEAVEQGFGRVRWPGRLQVETIRGTTWIFDVAHNPAGVEVLVDSLDKLDIPRPLVLLTGILADKEWRPMLRPLLARADAAILTIPPTAPASRRWNPAEVAEWAATETGSSPSLIPDFRSALDRAVTLAPHGTVLVTGSVHTVGDALAELGIPVS